MVLATVGAASTLPGLCHCFGWSPTKDVLAGAVCRRTWGRGGYGASKVHASHLWEVFCSHLRKLLSKGKTGMEGQICRRNDRLGHAVSKGMWRVWVPCWFPQVYVFLGWEGNDSC